VSNSVLTLMLNGYWCMVGCDESKNRYLEDMCRSDSGLSV